MDRRRSQCSHPERSGIPGLRATLMLSEGESIRGVKQGVSSRGQGRVGQTGWMRLSVAEP